MEEKGKDALEVAQEAPKAPKAPHEAQGRRAVIAFCKVMR